MRVVDFIHKTRDGIELTADELQFLINGYTAGSIPDYQMSAWTMAVYFKGLSANETAALTLAWLIVVKYATFLPFQALKWINIVRVV